VIDVKPIEPEAPDIGPELRLAYQFNVGRLLHLGQSEAHFRALDSTLAASRDHMSAGFWPAAAKRARHPMRQRYWIDCAVIVTGGAVRLSPLTL
jgi:hypothetical protein